MMVAASKHWALAHLDRGLPRRGASLRVVATHGGEACRVTFFFQKDGGRTWIRTREGVSQQIYSLPSLAT